MGLEVIILAAGQGTRMKSAMPKVLHRLAHLPLLEHVYRAACALHPEGIHIVYGHGGEAVARQLAHLEARWVEQPEQLGTGHAVGRALPELADDARVLVLYGDVPLVRPATLLGLAEAGDGALALLTAQVVDPAGYGRILRDADGRVQGIVEHKDAREEQRRIKEINTGMLAVPTGLLRGWLENLDNDNAQGEYYLTDIVALAVGDGVEVRTVQPERRTEILGVNDRVQLAHLERHYQHMNAEQLMRAGVTLRDPARFDLRGELEAGRDVVIDVNVVIEGRVRLGDRVEIGPGVVLRETSVGDDVKIDANSVVESAKIAAGCRIGPFSRIRPGTELADEVHIGNFVELKNSQIGKGSKINHLSYVGDTTVGAGVNIGAGTITCNYDGANKHRTVIGDGAFIGSNTQLIAPVEIGAGATIGAGSTISSDAPPGELTLGRARQTTIKGWKRPTKGDR